MTFCDKKWGHLKSKMSKMRDGGRRNRNRRNRRRNRRRIVIWSESLLGIPRSARDNT